MSDISALLPALTERAGGVCELCGATDDLRAVAVPPMPELTSDRAILACPTCADQLAGEAPLDTAHWFCLQGSAWSEVPAVQVTAWRTLGRLGETWAIELRDQLYLPDEVAAWAKAGEADADRPKTLDSNGTELADGDAVTLIQDLDVKGTSFVAKRGTVVKGIRLTDDPALVEGRVNKIGIVLKTCFLKKAR